MGQGLEASGCKDIPLLMILCVFFGTHIAHSYLNNLDHKVTKSPQGYPIDFYGGTRIIPSYDARDDPSERMTHFDMSIVLTPHGKILQETQEPPVFYY